jgi:hypothetical protein
MFFFAERAGRLDSMRSNGISFFLFKAWFRAKPYAELNAESVGFCVIDVEAVAVG